MVIDPELPEHSEVNKTLNKIISSKLLTTKKVAFPKSLSFRNIFNKQGKYIIIYKNNNIGIFHVFHNCKVKTFATLLLL